jgi:glycyl-tRNA synthetase beta subunit
MTTQKSPLHVDLSDFAEQARALGKSESWINNGFRSLLKKASLFGERAAREGAPRDTSALARSIVSESSESSARVFTPLNYAMTVEEGRRPGAKMPPPEALRGWARRHGFQGSLFVLARAIARRGIKGRFFMKAATQKVNQKMPDWMRELFSDVRQDFER